MIIGLEYVRWIKLTTFFNNIETTHMDIDRIFFFTWFKRVVRQQCVMIRRQSTPINAIKISIKLPSNVLWCWFVQSPKNFSLHLMYLTAPYSIRFRPDSKKVCNVNIIIYYHHIYADTLVVVKLIKILKIHHRYLQRQPHASFYG